MQKTTFEQRLVLIGNKVKELRLQRNLTIEQLSEKSGINTKYLRKIEDGKAICITTKHLYHLKKALNLSSVNDILYFY